MEIHREVRPRFRGAVENVHAVVQHSRQVGVDVRERVEKEKRARGRAREVARVEGGHRPARPEAHQVIRPLGVKLPWQGYRLKNREFIGKPEVVHLHVEGLTRPTR